MRVRAWCCSGLHRCNHYTQDRSRFAARPCRNADSCTYPETGRRGQAAQFALCAQLIRLICPSEPLTTDTHDRGILIAERYGFSVYDTLIVASARLSGGETLVLRGHAGWARGRRTGANLIHSKRSRRQRLEPATPSPCLATGIPLLLHGSDDQRAERVIFDERSAVAEDRALAWTLHNLQEIEDRRAVPLQATRQALVDKRGGLCGRSTSSVAASWWQPSKMQTVSASQKTP
ncbi:MAG: putative nucleic-acid-binding protein contains domain [Caballeronia mineralivorans]|jgi:hypothetical protein|nr:putative nucleic-acid-binding protein contains domain [Caballeronia mineralivorans]